MKISTKWLNEYVSLDGISAETLASSLTTAGIEIEGIERMAKGDNLVIGKVISCSPHPDSDHLQVCLVDVGDKKQQIVCGASNCREGIKVIVAQVGAKLSKIEIKESVIRGVESNGMLCSLQELGVQDKYLREDQIQGIEILPDDAVVGNKEVLEYLGLEDIILDASLTPNRADCMAMFSVAKEVAAVLRRETRLPEIKKVVGNASTQAYVETKTQGCRHLLGRVINKVEVKESPIWMQKHLQAAGIKSINNVVDISNYVMLETGQPLHFYDLSKMEKQEIIVRDQYEGQFIALDGEEYTLQKNDLVIENNEKVIGIAGIMGSEDSKIDENTKGIFIEAAHFNHVHIRNTSKRLNLITEAASRFSKGLDPLAQEKAMHRATDLLIQYANASEVEEIKEAGTSGYTPVVVEETLEHCNALLGTNYTIEEVVEVLRALDFNPQVTNTTIRCEIPSYRRDIEIPEDLDEEIIRLIGFNRLPTTLPLMETTVGKLTKEQTLRRMTRQVLTGQGLSEIMTYTLVKEQFIKEAVLPFGEVVELASPMSEDRRFVRNSLMSSMLECLSYNQARKAENVNLFEISTVYQQGSTQERCGMVLSGNLHQSKLYGKQIGSDFYVLKGVVLTWLLKWGFEKSQIDIRPNQTDTLHFHPYRSAEVIIENEVVGVFGEVHPLFSKQKDVSVCSYAEFVLDKLFDKKVKAIRFKALNRYPAVSRDLALVVKEECFVQEIEQVILTIGKSLVQSVEVFDVYQGEHIEKGYKSIALRLIYQAKDHTLVEEEVQAVHQEILNQLKEQLDVALRS